ncbi:hypothetical protein [Bizionia sp.]|uniref:hypothetical protein n=1 Tax=Bizionia sp. TaxID=1954480 RepID=UPI003A938020
MKKGKVFAHLPNGEMMLREPFIYYKRVGNRFFFESKYTKIDFEMEGKNLFDFVDKYSIGDEVKFYE